MTLFTLLLLAVGLSMDAFAVSVSNGICYRDYSKTEILATALAFGGFQGLMPILGFLAGNSVLGIIQQVDHVIALALLGYLGGKMIWDAVKEIRHPEADCCPATGFTPKGLLLQAIATSIDALAVGISLAALGASIVPASLFIAAVTFGCSLAGVFLGRKFGAVLKSRAELLGGGILVAIGVKIFLEHTLG